MRRCTPRATSCRYSSALGACLIWCLVALQNKHAATMFVREESPPSCRATRCSPVHCRRTARSLPIPWRAANAPGFSSHIGAPQYQQWPCWRRKAARRGLEREVVMSFVPIKSPLAAGWRRWAPGEVLTLAEARWSVLTQQPGSRARPPEPSTKPGLEDLGERESSRKTRKPQPKEKVKQPNGEIASSHRTAFVTPTPPNL